ncbi:hypothetical protein ACHAXT_002545 [Thalassiosira profunda]
MSLLRPLSALGRAAAGGGGGRAPSLRPSTPSILATTAHAQHPALAIAHRSKHSATQVNRLFNKNPARYRLMKKQGLLSTPPPVPDRTYPPIFRPTFLRDGWSAPPPPEVEVPEYPFKVARTGGKPFGAVGYLPVYRDVRIHGTKHTTIIRNVAGDVPAFLNELRAVLKLPLGKKGVLTSTSTGAHGGGEAGRGVNANNPIRIRSGGAIEVNGDRAREVKKWLAGLGF